MRSASLQVTTSSPIRSSQQAASASLTPTPEKVSWAGFGKALGLSAGTAITAAAIAMYIDQFSTPACTVVGDCVPISTTMKGRHVPTPEMHGQYAWCEAVHCLGTLFNDGLQQHSKTALVRTTLYYSRRAACIHPRHQPHPLLQQQLDSMPLQLTVSLRLSRDLARASLTAVLSRCLSHWLCVQPCWLVRTCLRSC